MRVREGVVYRSVQRRSGVRSVQRRSAVPESKEEQCT
jgi:hypothetical protein